MIEPTIGLEFDEPSHTYHYYGEPMESVTKFVGSFKKEFDANYWSDFIANRRGISQDEVLSEWDAKRDSACDTGDLVHAEAEHVANQVAQTGEFTWPFWDGTAAGKMEALYRWWADHMEMAQGEIWPELKVVQPDVRLAGTVDLVASNLDGVPSIADYKQNESIDLMGKYNNMLPPFTRGKLKLPDLNFWTYALQLNVYRRIMVDRYDYYAERLVLVHLMPTGAYHEYEVPIMDDHVNKLWELRR
jgi:hypothetical protein